MASYTGADRAKASSDALRRSLGMAPRRNPKNKKKGTHRRRGERRPRKTSRETRQVATS